MKLSSDEIRKALAGHPGWSLHEDSIKREFAFKDFTEAMGFVNHVAELAEEASHHPDIDIRWNQVTLALSTHSEGGLTEKDFSLAGQIDAL